MTREIGVAPVPGSSFFPHPEHRFIRLHFAKSPAVLGAASERLLRLTRTRAEGDSSAQAWAANI